VNIRQDLYCSGATLTVRFINQRKTGRRVAVMDPARRSRAAIVGMLLGGMKPRDVARALDIPISRVCALGIVGLRSHKKIVFAP
jgi:hypothetical protein